MLLDSWFAIVTWWRFRCYKQRKLTPNAVLQWYRQFEVADRPALRRLVRHIQYVPEEKFEGVLLGVHKQLLARLRSDGYLGNQIIFMSFDDAGSSSTAVLNVLRDSARLEVQRFKMLHSGEISKIGAVTFEVGEGVLVYVDDFVGSGRQLIRNIRNVRPLIQGNFVEVALAVCVCEEAVEDLKLLGVDSFEHILHLKADRPLHVDSACLAPVDKNRLLELCARIAPPHGLGFRRMATMVVLYRNAPNNTPMVLRGNIGQSPLLGLLPRTTDLAVPPDLMYSPAVTVTVPS